MLLPSAEEPRDEDSPACTRRSRSHGCHGLRGILHLLL